MIETLKIHVKNIIDEFMYNMFISLDKCFYNAYIFVTVGDNIFLLN
jgi:hypothetical protein